VKKKSRVVKLFTELKYRWIILLGTGLITFGLIGWAQKIKGWLYIKWGVELGWTPATLKVAIVAAPFAFLMWLWREQNKDRELRTREKEEIHRGKEIALKEKDEARIENAKINTFISSVIDDKLSDRERADVAYRLAEVLSDDVPESPRNIRILELFRSTINMEINENNTLVKVLQKILVDFIKSGKYHWYRFKNFNFSTANFSDINFSGYNFQECQFNGCSFYCTKAKTFNSMSSFRNCSFCNVEEDYGGPDLYIKKTSFTKASFAGVDFSGSDFSDCDLTDNVNFAGAQLSNVKFNNSILCHSHPIEN